MPDERMSRHCSYNLFALNLNSTGKTNPFLFSGKLANIIGPSHAICATDSLFTMYKENSKDYHFARLSLVLTTAWQHLPSVNANDHLTHYYLSKGDVDVELNELDNGFTSIRSKRASSEPVEIELLYRKSLVAITFSDLPESIKEIVANCRGFRSEPLECKPEMTALDYLNALIDQRSGSCRHRTVVFMSKMQELGTAIPCRYQVITNTVHVFPEIFYKGQWVKCDLGGYDAEIKIDNQRLPELYTLEQQKPAPFDNPQEHYAVTFSAKGIPAPSDYFERAKNLVELNLKHLSKLPTQNKLLLLDKLQLTNCQLTVDELFLFFTQAPNIKTVSLIHCTISPDDFQKMPLFLLNKLEHITLKGSFIPSHAALDGLMRTIKTNPKWIIESVNITQHQVSTLFAEKVVLNTVRREPPTSRYFSAPAPLEAHQWLSAEWKAGLIDTENPQALRILLQGLCQRIKKPCFYIHKPEELRCSMTSIEREGLRGVIKKGPTGAFYDFLMENQAESCVLLIDFTQFTPATMVRFNTLFNEVRMVDGVIVPPLCQIIGFINSSLPECYSGADFYSRFSYFQAIKKLSVESFPALPNTTFGLQRTIELYGGSGWEARLIGKWMLEEHQFTWCEGELIKALREGVVHITLNNGPQDNTDFNRFLDDLSLHQAVFYRGRREFGLPKDFSLQLTAEVLFKEHHIAHLDFAREPDFLAYPLNQHTLPDFLGKYRVEPISKGLKLLPGLIAQHAGSKVSICVTETLTEKTWMLLLQLAQDYNVRLHLTLVEDVCLPNAFMLQGPHDHLRFSFMAHTNIIKLEGMLNYPEEALVINVSEVEPSQLLPSLSGEFNEEKATFMFVEHEGYLTHALQKGMHVVLTGVFSNALARALHPLLFKRLSSGECSGTLWLVPVNDIAFSFMTSSNAISSRSKMTPFKMIAEFDERYEVVFSVLTTYPCVYLTGATGIGKTHFISHRWHAAHPHCHYNEENIIHWILDERPGIKTLFLDEANLTYQDWSIFSGLFASQPAIFYRKHYYKLSFEHKVIFAGNPLSYGGERHLPSLFNDYPITVEFKPLPKAVLLNILQVNDEVADAILGVIADANFITPRELIMMGALTKAAVKTYPDTLPVQWGRYFAYALLKSHASTVYLAKFIDKIPVSPLSLPPNLGKLILNSSNHEAISALTYHLNLRRLRHANDSSVPVIGGLGGVILEGEPGVGKSMVIIECLKHYGLQEAVDYWLIPASLSTKEKSTILLDLFKRGKIAVIDEVNSAPMPEKLLNALLEGHDLEGMPADVPGFMLIGSQNPITYKGRIQTTLPLKHRLQTVYVENNTDHDLQLILASYNIPPCIALDMIQEFRAHQIKNAMLCTRDLLTMAKHWPGPCQSVAINLDSLQQVGSICKIAAIANVESYYSQCLYYPPMPLHARKLPLMSIRKLAKQFGSVQGEILEFQRWQQLLDVLGFESEVERFNNDDIQRFIIVIQRALQHNHLPLIVFAVDKPTGHPDAYSADIESHEHAAVIIGYNVFKDELTIAHWGNIYNVDLVSLFNANQALPTTRRPEYYKKNLAYNQSNKFYEHKYLVDEKPSERNSIIPEPNTGFKGSLLIAKEPNRELLLERRARYFSQLAESNTLPQLTHNRSSFFALTPNAMPSSASEQTRHKRCAIS